MTLNQHNSAKKSIYMYASMVVLSWAIKHFDFIKWQVCDLLAKRLIMSELMVLGWPRLSRRSNVGLV